MMKLSGIVLLGVCSFVFACQAQQPAEAKLAGQIVLADGWRNTVYLVAPSNFMEVAGNYQGLVLDSAAIQADGTFQFDAIPVQNPNGLLCYITVQPTASRYPQQLIDDNPVTANYLPLVLMPGAAIHLDARVENLQSSGAIAAPDAQNKAIFQLRQIRQTAWANHLQTLLSDTTHEEHALLEQEHALRDFQMELSAFADTTQHFWPALLALRWISPPGDYERLPELMVRQCEKWQRADNDNPWVAQLCAYGQRNQLPVLIGDTIPNALLPLSIGDTVLLHDQLGAKLTLLDIWASWCAPCRKENRLVLAPLRQQYTREQWQVVAYSIDSDQRAWLNAISKDNAAWTHASHLSGDDAPLLQMLRISTIPANYLLDAEGRIVARNLHGQELEQFITDYLKAH